MNDVIYLDNAASSWPKPAAVAVAVAEAVSNYGANPGRGAHTLALTAGRKVLTARKQLARFFGASNTEDIIFTKNTTEALNLPLQAYLQAGDHVLVSAVEHNSVIRPLEYLKQKGVTYSRIAANSQGVTTIAGVEEALTRHPNCKLLAVSHASNVVGTLFPLAETSELLKKHDVKLLVDAAQTAGVYDIDVNQLKIDFLAFPGHKGLLGPQGTGGLYINPEIELSPLLYGGTGGNSESRAMPTTRPDRYESGTPNTPGIAGLMAGLDFINQTTLATIREHEWQLTSRLLTKLQNIPIATIYGPEHTVQRAAVVAFNLAGMESNEVAYMLDKVYKIAVRAGHHCSPDGHQTLNTIQQGVVRVSPGFFNTTSDIDKLIEAVEEIADEI